MRGLAAAAPADDADPVLNDEAFEPLRQLPRAQRVMRAPANQLGQPGIGLHRDRPRPVVAKPFDMLGHLARAGGAVEPNDRHVERVDDRRHRHLDDDRDVPCAIWPRRLARPLRAVDGGLDLQRILAGLDEDRVDPAGNEPGALDGKGVFEVLIGDVPERGQPRPRPERAEDKAGAPVMGELGDRLARQFAGAAIEIEGFVGDAELAQGDRRGAEAVGLDRIGPGLEVVAVHLADEIGTALAQDLGAVLVAVEIVLDVKVAGLRLGPHRAIA